MTVENNKINLNNCLSFSDISLINFQTQIYSVINND
jgi:hypothetical protein